MIRFNQYSSKDSRRHISYCTVDGRFFGEGIKGDWLILNQVQLKYIKYQQDIINSLHELMNNDDELRNAITAWKNEYGVMLKEHRKSYRLVEKAVDDFMSENVNLRRKYEIANTLEQADDLLRCIRIVATPKFRMSLDQIGI